MSRTLKRGPWTPLLRRQKPASLHFYGQQGEERGGAKGGFDKGAVCVLCFGFRMARACNAGPAKGSLPVFAAHLSTSLTTFHTTNKLFPRLSLL